MGATRRPGWLRIVWVVGLIGGPWAWAAPAQAAQEAPAVPQVRLAIERSLPVIQDRGRSWIEDKDCVSCHRVDMMVWSLAAARRHGFPVSDRLEEWQAWSVASSLAPTETGAITGLGNKEGVAHLLLGGAGNTEARPQLISLLTRDQQPDGCWKAGGQLPVQKRPAAETDAVSTIWLALALADEPAPEAVAAVAAARDAITRQPPGVSTEWHALRVILASRDNEPGIREEGIQALRAAQHEDGGWGWLLADPSDALGTGLAMYALRAAGVAPDDPALVRACSLLVTSQAADGSWPVPGTKAKKKDQIEETATYWGTTWAVLGLLATLPEPAHD